MKGIWCSCWKLSNSGGVCDDYVCEVGSLLLRQAFTTVTGGFYSAARSWAVKGKLIENGVELYYRQKDGSHGKVDLRYTDNGKNTDRMEGQWNGRIRVYDNGNAIKTEDVHAEIRTARKDCYKYECSTKRFGTGEGICWTVGEQLLRNEA